jgi:hypothetical protein
MPVWIHGSQLMSRVQMTDFELMQGCITKSLTPHDEHGQPIRPVDVVLQYITGLEQELSRLDEVAWNLIGLEREQIIANQIEPLEERLQNSKLYLRSIEKTNWDGFELPKERDLEACFVSCLINSRFHAEEVDRFLPGHPRPSEEQRLPSLESKPSRSMHAQGCRKKCREIAKRIWDRQPDFTIAGMISHSEILRQAKRPDGNPYSEITVRNWIRDLCPNPKRGRRPSRRSTFSVTADNPSIGNRRRLRVAGPLAQLCGYVRKEDKR